MLLEQALVLAQQAWIPLVLEQALVQVLVLSAQVLVQVRLALLEQVLAREQVLALARVPWVPVLGQVLVLPERVPEQEASQCHRRGHQCQDAAFQVQLFLLVQALSGRFQAQQFPCFLRIRCDNLLKQFLRLQQISGVIRYAFVISLD